MITVSINTDGPFFSVAIVVEGRTVNVLSKRFENFRFITDVTPCC
jgi:hypothetical protein